MTFSAQTPEPTDEQREAAVAAMGCTQEDEWQEGWCVAHDHGWQYCHWVACARALAAAVTAEREKYERLAGEMEGMTENMQVVAKVLTADGKKRVALMKRGQAAGIHYAARRIREVSR